MEMMVWMNESQSDATDFESRILRMTYGRRFSRVSLMSQASVSPVERP